MTGLGTRRPGPRETNHSSPEDVIRRRMIIGVWQETSHDFLAGGTEARKLPENWSLDSTA